MKDGSAGVEIKEFVGLELKIYSFLVDNGEDWKAKDVNRNDAATISHSEYEDVLLNNEYIKHSINRIQSKDIE